MSLSLSLWYPLDDERFLCCRRAGAVRGGLPGGWPESPGNLEGQPDASGKSAVNLMRPSLFSDMAVLAFCTCMQMVTTACPEEDCTRRPVEVHACSTQIPSCAKDPSAADNHEY